MSNTSTLNLPRTPLRQDAGVIGLVGIAHMISHYSQLLLAPLFPWLKTEFNVSYAELGFLMTIFFVVSCGVQTAAGFVVDRFGPRPVLLAGLALLGLSAFGFAASHSYWTLAAFSVLAGIGNGVFHPVDYTLLNHKVSSPRLGHAYSVHGITGSLGWALAPAMLVPLTIAYSWRVALSAAGLLAFAVLAVLLVYRDRLHMPPSDPAAARRGSASPAAAAASRFGFLAIPAVWMCFAFFFFYAASLSVVQTFGPEAARQLHGMPTALLAACLTSYMLASATGMVFGGFLAANAERCERVVGIAFGLAACVALYLAFGSFPGEWVPVFFGAMGFCVGISGPSRDLLVKRSTPANATGRVYGVVYSGLDIGQAFVPLLVGQLMDHGQFRTVLLALAALQGVLIFNALNVGRVRRAPVPVAA